MNRREVLVFPFAAAIAGCTDFSVLSSMRELGETATFGKLEVNATDAMTAQTVYTYLDTLSGEQGQTHTAPSNATFALFHLRVHNTDITEQDGPAVNTANYEVLTEDDDTIYLSGINDVRVYGGSEGGHLPESSFGTGISFEGIRVNGAELAAYPAGPGGFGPTVEPTGTIAGWTFGVVPKDKPPRLKVQFMNKSVIWSANTAE